MPTTVAQVARGWRAGAAMALVWAMGAASPALAIDDDNVEGLKRKLARLETGS